MPGTQGKTMGQSPLPHTPHLRHTQGQEAPWISTGRRAKHRGQPSPSLRLLCGKQWKEAKGRERLPGRKHLAAFLSQDREQFPALRRTASSLLLGSPIPAPFAMAPLPQRCGFEGELPDLPPPAHTPVIRQRPQTLTLGSPIFSLSHQSSPTQNCPSAPLFQLQW